MAKNRTEQFEAENSQGVTFLSRLKPVNLPEAQFLWV